MKYIAFYDLPEYSAEKRSVAPAAADVVRYMAEVMGDSEPIEIVCPARTLNTKGCFKKRRISLSESVSLAMPFSFGVRTVVGRWLSLAQIQLWLFFYLLFTTKKHETVVVYHSLSYMRAIRFLKRLKKWNLILEIREIYADAKERLRKKAGTLERLRAKELCFFSWADGYIFPTTLLNDEINGNKKPAVIAPGVYRAEERYSVPLHDGALHVVYAGTLSKEKGGAFAAVSAARYLSSLYHLHLLGYGSESEQKELKACIDAANALGGATVTYDGLLRGREFSSFLQSCHIGLATQDMTKSFNDSSFPSKILVYLANGLQVVSGRIPAVETSSVGRYCFYYDKQLPESIAAAILSVPHETKRNDITVFLSDLDADLKRQMINLLCTEKRSSS